MSAQAGPDFWEVKAQGAERDADVWAAGRSMTIAATLRAQVAPETAIVA